MRWNVVCVDRVGARLLRRSGPRGFLVSLICVLGALLGCESSPTQGADAGTDATPDGGDGARRPLPQCPEDWVPAERGGCGPAVILCAPDGGAALGVCVGRDLRTPRTVRDPDGEEGTAFYLQENGEIGGGWSRRPWTCRPGWRQMRDGSCAANLREDCPANTMPLPDGTCTATGADQCRGTFADVPPEAAGQRVLYVLESATGTADGSRDAPYPTMTAAMAAHPTAEWFMLGRGRYDLNIYQERSIHVIGACAPLTLVGAATGVFPPTVEVQGIGHELHLEGVTLGSAGVSAAAAYGASMRIVKSVVLSGTVSTLRLDEDVRGAMSDVVVFGTRNSGRRAIEVQNRSSIILRRVHVVAGDSPGVVVGLGSSMNGEDLVVSDFADTGLYVTEGSTARLVGAALVNGQSTGILMYGRGQLDDIDIHGVVPSGAMLTRNAAIHAGFGGQISARRVRISDVANNGIRIRKLGTHVDVEDLVIEDTRPLAGRGGGEGIWMSELSTARVRRASISRVHGSGVRLQEDPTVDLREIAVRTVLPELEGFVGTGLSVFVGGHITSRRVLVEGHSASVIAAIGLPPRTIRLIPNPEEVWGRAINPIARIDTVDLIARRQQPRVERRPVTAIMLGSNTTLQGDRIALDGVHGIGVAVLTLGLSTERVIQELVLNDQIPAEAAGPLRVALGPSLDGPSSATVQNLYVRDLHSGWILSSPEVASEPEIRRAAYSLYVGAGSTLRVEDFAMDGAADGEIGAVSLGRLQLSQGVLRNHRRCAIARNSLVEDAVIEVSDVERIENGGDGICDLTDLPIVQVPASPN